MKAWDAYLKKLTGCFGNAIITRWLVPLKIIRFDAGNLYLEAQDSFQIMWFKEHIAPRLKQEFISDTGRPIKVHLSLKGQNTQKKQSTKAPLPKITYESTSLNPKLTFETFLASDDCVALQVLKSPDVQFNPIFIYGPKGCGKTHLLTAYAHASSGAFFTHAQTFTEHVVNAMRTSDMDTFRATYRSVGALIIDDIHIIAKRTATQEELFHTFNALHTAGVQIVFSSHLPPSQLTDIEPRLISRFEWGITLPLQAPTSSILKQILQNRLHDFPLEENIQNFLLHTFPSASDLFEALEALMLRVHLEKIKVPLSLAQAEHMLADLTSRQKKQALTPPTILKAVAENFEITTDDLLGKSQARECSLPRKIAMYFFRQKLKMPYAKIGEHFSRDHSTVITSCHDIAKHYAEHRQHLEAVENTLQ